MADQYRSIKGELKLLKAENDFLFPIEIWAYNNQLTLNGWRFDNLEAHREQWAGVPVLCAYVNNGRKVGDGHNQRTKLDQNGEEYQSFTDATAERIVGATSENPDDIRVEADGENKWLVVNATLYRWYARELTDYIIAKAEQGGSMAVSIEVLVTASHTEGDVEVEDSYIPLGITLLGEGVAPAVPGAHVAMLTEMGDELKELKLRAASYLEHSTEKPQENLNTKGMTKRMRLSKQAVRTLQEKFGEYTVLAAEQNEDGSVLVCLMAKNGATAMYKMASVDESVVLDRVVSVNAQIHFCADGCDDVLVDACDMVETVAGERDSFEAQLSEATDKLTEATATIEKMVSAENSRRLSAAKAKVAATLAAFNENRDNKIDAKVLESLNKDVEAGKFTACADENGAWTGEQVVEEKVLSLCAAAVMEQDKKNATHNNGVISWGSVRRASANPGTVGEMLANNAPKQN